MFLKTLNPLRIWGAAIAAFTTLLLLTIVPGAVLSSGASQTHFAVPDGIATEAPWGRPRVQFGQPFPSYPAKALLIKGLGHFGLRFDTFEGQVCPPAVLLWSDRLDFEGNPPEEAVTLGLLGGTPSIWIPLPEGNMRSRGYLTLYLTLEDRVEVCAPGQIQEVGFE